MSSARGAGVILNGAGQPDWGAMIAQNAKTGSQQARLAAAFSRVIALPGGSYAKAPSLPNGQSLTRGEGMAQVGSVQVGGGNNKFGSTNFTLPVYGKVAASTSSSQSSTSKASTSGATRSLPSSGSGRKIASNPDPWHNPYSLPDLDIKRQLMVNQEVNDRWQRMKNNVPHYSYSGYKQGQETGNFDGGTQAATNYGRQMSIYSMVYPGYADAVARAQAVEGAGVMASALGNVKFQPPQATDVDELYAKYAKDLRSV